MSGFPRLSVVVLFPVVLGCAASAPATVVTPAPPPFDRAAAERDVARELDDIHDAAAHADEARLFAHFAPSGVFLGTDATERWDMAAFRAYAHPRFAQGKGWTFHVERRAVAFDAGGGSAWFDEDLRGERLGAARGSGVLLREGGRWVVLQYNLALTVPNERFGDVRALLDAPPPVDLSARYREAYRAATTALGAGELRQARELLSALVPEAKTRPGDDTEFWLANALTWVRWSEGDLDGARAEVESAKAALDHATLPADKARALRLHELWDRAYLSLERARREKGATRAKALAEADRDRGAYEALAKSADDHDGMAVLAAFFAWVRGDGRAAAVAARKVDLAHDDDLRDLYVIALALDAAADHDAADRVRERICAGREYLMKPIIARAMRADGHPCAHTP
jgi:hypothetical protein